LSTAPLINVKDAEQNMRNCECGNEVLERWARNFDWYDSFKTYYL